MNAPAIFIGIQSGLDESSSIELFNLVDPVGELPSGSTVSRQTLEFLGFHVDRNEFGTRSVRRMRRSNPGRTVEETR